MTDVFMSGEMFYISAVMKTERLLSLPRWQQLDLFAAVTSSRASGMKSRRHVVSGITTEKALCAPAAIGGLHTVAAGARGACPDGNHGENLK